MGQLHPTFAARPRRGGGAANYYVVSSVGDLEDEIAIGLNFDDISALPASTTMTEALVNNLPSEPKSCREAQASPEAVLGICGGKGDCRPHQKGSIRAGRASAMKTGGEDQDALQAEGQRERRDFKIQMSLRRLGLLLPELGRALQHVGVSYPGHGRHPHGASTAAVNDMELRYTYFEQAFVTTYIDTVMYTELPEAYRCFRQLWES